MNLPELIKRTRRYVRDTTSKRFTDEEISEYINEGIDRLRSYPVLRDMPYIDMDDDIYYLPDEYHYMLALYASSKCFAVDLDFYQEVQKRNEFENLFDDLISKIESGYIDILDMTMNPIDYTYPVDYITDEYFNTTSTDEDSIIG